MDNLQRIMLLNGLLVILVASLSGFMLLFQLVGGFEVWPDHIIEIPVSVSYTHLTLPTILLV